ncbi:MAG: cytochrome c oxidase subunit II [Gammaproteobacteria bacterium]|nr:cytochrome c oxidase subunit II [Gammaproteobacteria bacterium]
MLRKLCLGIAGLFGAGSATADWALNMPQGVTELSAETYGLHMQVFYWCCAIAVVVFGAMIYSLVKHRKSLGVEPAQFSHSMKAEVIWTIIPIVILLIMAVPSAETMIRLEDTRKPDLTIVATGYQWKWHYEYQGENLEFYSTLSRSSADARRKDSGIDPFTVDNYLLDVDNRLVVPKGRKVRLLLTSSDVVHAWWVPDLAIKKDAIPGFVNEAWFRAEVAGVYRGQCAELCGMDHGYMPIVVEVVEPAEYQAWLDSRRDDAASVAAAR